MPYTTMFIVYCFTSIDVERAFIKERLKIIRLMELYQLFKEKSCGASG